MPDLVRVTKWAGLINFRKRLTHDVGQLKEYA